jgi:NAD(P)-dependent dehydrogenase (short-subunit alcohol dehydrogenase family)
MTTKPVILILGAGGNIGANLTTKFSKAGYSIALASRSRTNGFTPEGHLNIQVDLSNPTAIPAVFQKTQAALGKPSVVIYNAATMRPPPNPEDMFSLSVEDLESDVRLMTISAFAAAKEAVKLWDSLSKDEGGKKVFIYTGNILNKTVMASSYVLTLGVGKAGAAYWIGTASALYKEKGYK